MTVAGLEPTIPRSNIWCLIHQATQSTECDFKVFYCNLCLSRLNVRLFITVITGDTNGILFSQIWYNFYYKTAFLCFLFTIKVRKSSESSRIVRAVNHQTLTGAIPLLTHTGTLGCWVFPLAQSAPSQTTWCSKAPHSAPC